MTFLQQLSDAIDIQQQRQDQEYNELMSKPLQERVSRGYTMTNLHAEFEFYDGAPTRFTPAPTGTMRYIDRVRIRCEYNISKFREGTQVRLSHGPLSFVMEIERDDVNDFTLRSGAFEVKNNLLDIRDCPRDGWEINAVNSDITYRLLRATWENLYSHPDFCDHLERFLTGQFRNQYRESPSPTCGNPSQNEAIRKAFACNYFHLIQGPPGTGKTFTIAKIVYFLMKMGKKVFVTAPTHTAINNCLNAIANELQDKRFVVKVGERHQADEILHNPHITRKTSLKLRDYQSNPELSQAGFVAGGTPFALCYPASKKLEGWQFDYVIVDEAAQMSIPLALPAIMHGRRLIFVGDHQQLDPIVPQDTGNKFFDRSIFRQLADLYPQDVTLLDCSYRLNESLIHIPNQLFYDGRITAEHELQRPYTAFTCDAAPQIVNHPSNELLVVHHGISWGGGIRRIAGGEYEVVKAAISANIALYAAHLPLDANRKVGNNWELARSMKLRRVSPAFSYHGNVIGVVGFDARGRKVGVCSGGAGEFAVEAKALGCDLYVTGEASWGERIAAENVGMKMVCRGHYETETFGVKALAAAMSKALGVRTVFIGREDEP